MSEIIRTSSCGSRKTQGIFANWTPKRHFKSYASVDEIQFSSEGLYEQVRLMAQDVHEGVLKQPASITKLRSEVWLCESESIEKEKPPMTRIGFCGATGSGKSSVLNSLLGANIVATSALRACTAVVIEVSYHKHSTVAADVKFVSPTKWREQISLFLADLKDTDIGDVKRQAKLSSSTGGGESVVAAWSKFELVYPGLSLDQFAQMSVDDIVASNAEVSDMLGSTKTISADDVQAFEVEICKYIDSNNLKIKKEPSPPTSIPQAADQGVSNPISGLSFLAKLSHVGNVMPPLIKQDPDAPTKVANDPKPGEIIQPVDDSKKAVLWPLIEQVAIRCNAPVLSTGAVFVDLPGTSDANAARNRIAKDHIASCDHLFIFAPITRAVDDGAANRLMGDSLRRQLIMDGTYDPKKISFIMTKTDDVSCSEVIKNLRLEERSDFLGVREQVVSCDAQHRECQDEHVRATQSVDDLREYLLEANKLLVEQEKHEIAQIKQESPEPSLKSGTPIEQNKKRPSDSGDPHAKRQRIEGCAGHVAPDTPQSPTQYTSAQIEEMIENGRKELAKRKDAAGKACQNVMSAQRAQLQAQKKLKAYCSLRRSEISKELLQEDFRQNLKVFREERLEQNQKLPSMSDPGSADLPVFCCSSQEYNKLQGLVKTSVDGDASVFTEPEDTGIPALQSWCRTLPLPSQVKAGTRLLRRLTELAEEILECIEKTNGDIDMNLVRLKQSWETDVSQTNRDAKVDDSNETSRGISARLRRSFPKIFRSEIKKLKARLKGELRDACQKGAEVACTGAREVAETFLNGLHHQTLLANFRRYGHHRGDLNESLLRGLYETIAPTWAKVFDGNILSSFTAAMEKEIDTVLKEVKMSCPPSLRKQAEQQIMRCKIKTMNRLSLRVEVARDALQAKQRELSRTMIPHVQRRLRKGYDGALLVTPTGRQPITVLRKRKFYEYLHEHRKTVFLTLVEMLMDGLDEAIDSLESSLSRNTKLAQEVEVSMSALWDGVPQGLDLPQVTARHDFQRILVAVPKQAKLWATAQKRASAAVSAPEPIAGSSGQN